MEFGSSEAIWGVQENVEEVQTYERGDEFMNPSNIYKAI